MPHGVKIQNTTVLSFLTWFFSWVLRCVLSHGSTNPRCQPVRATKFCMVVPNICGSSIWNLLHVTLQASQILMWLLEPLS
jgi:hypothetical protein